MLVGFLPGFAWTLVFFQKLHVLERFVLSIGLSIAIVTLSILVLHNILGIAVSGINSLIIIIIITIIPFALYYLRRYLRNR